MPRRDDYGPRVDNEPVYKEEGVFVEPADGRTLECDETEEACAPDDNAPPGEVADYPTPGTPDDIPEDYGIETPPAADQMLHIERVGEDYAGFGDMGESGIDSTGDQPPEPGRAEAEELKLRSRALQDEYEHDLGVFTPLSEEERDRLEEAYGGNAADVIPDDADGTSATGSVDAPDHGGFPER